MVYRQAAVWLTDEEFAEVVEEIEHAVVSRVERAREGRTRRVVSLVVIPDEPTAGKG